MMDSGARGKQTAGSPAMRHPRPHGQAVGEIIERPILSSFREASRCWNTSSPPTAPARVSPTPALKTADAGYLTRKICDVAMDVIIAEDDCGAAIGVVEESHLRR